jgi:hypothetical protein
MIVLDVPYTTIIRIQTHYVQLGNSKYSINMWRLVVLNISLHNQNYEPNQFEMDTKIPVQ